MGSKSHFILFLSYRKDCKMKHMCHMFKNTSNKSSCHPNGLSFSTERGPRTTLRRQTPYPVRKRAEPPSMCGWRPLQLCAAPWRRTPFCGGPLRQRRVQSGMFHETQGVAKKISYPSPVFAGGQDEMIRSAIFWKTCSGARIFEIMKSSGYP